MKKLCLITIILNLLLLSIHGARILGIFPERSRSFYILGSSLMKSLAKHSNEVVVISYFGENNSTNNLNYTNIVLNNGTPDDTDIGLNLKYYDEDSNYQEIGNVIVKDLFSDPNVINLVQSNVTFDAVIVLQSVTDALKAFAWYYNAPLIILSAYGANSFVNPFVCNPTVLSYIPEPTLGYFSNMDLLQRIINFFTHIHTQVHNHWTFFPQQESIMKKFFTDAPPLADIMYNTSLVLLNTDVTVNPPVPLVPNMIEIGGFHIEKTEPLPKDLQFILDNSTKGVIYFNMENSLDPNKVPESIKKIFMDTFSEIDYDVLFKWDADNLSDVPHNVRVIREAPQQSILAHPKIKVMISHGGPLNTMEAVYYGVPTLMLPVLTEEKIFALNAKENGYALVVNLKDLRQEDITYALDELLHNSIYQEAAQRLSKIMRDKPVNASRKAVYWVEYVIKHKGAPFLRVYGLKLSWFQYHLLDILAILLSTIFIVVLAFIVIIKRTCCPKREFDSDSVISYETESRL